jgi:hypothetical protein
MSHQRIFKVSYDLAGDEIYSWVHIRRTDSRAEARYRARRTIPNYAPFLAVVGALPPGGFSPLPAQAARAAGWNALHSWQIVRQAIYSNQLLPEAVVTLPDGELQEEYRISARAARWSPYLAWQGLRRQRIESTVNDLQTLYPQGEWGEPLWYVLDEIQRHLLEPYANGGFFWYDGLWDTTEVLRYARNRVNDFLLQSGVDRQTETQAVALGATEVTVPSDSNVIRRAVWFDAAGASYPLELGDMHKADASDPGWESSSGVPERLILWGRGRAELHPIPDAAGTLLLDYVPIWDFTIPVGNPYEAPSTFYAALVTLVPIPSMFMPFIKYGIMADMLGKEGEGHDEDRATYCGQRFEEGIEIAKMWLGRRD